MEQKLTTLLFWSWIYINNSTSVGPHKTKLSKMSECVLWINSDHTEELDLARSDFLPLQFRQLD